MRLFRRQPSQWDSRIRCGRVSRLTDPNQARRLDVTITSNDDNYFVFEEVPSDPRHSRADMCAWPYLRIATCLNRL